MIQSIIVIIMTEGQTQQLLRIEPENVIVFYRNEFQSASTLKIMKSPTLKEPVRFQLKTTSKTSYLVSETSGQMSKEQGVRYINILIADQVPLEQCLHDKFKLLLFVPGRPPLEKKFKVIIDYKKDTIRSVNKDLQRLDVASKTSGGPTASTSILNNPITSIRQSMIKKSNLINTIGKIEGNQPDYKQELEDIVKRVQERRLRLQYLQQQIQKKKSRFRFMVYIAMLVIFCSYLFGAFIKKIVISGFDSMNTLEN